MRERSFIMGGRRDEKLRREELVFLLESVKGQLHFLCGTKE